MQDYQVIYGPSLIEVEKKRHAAVAKRKTIHETQWIPMFQAIKKAGPSVWGFKRHKNGHLNKNSRVISTVEKSGWHDGDSISNDTHNNRDPEWILTQPLEELPLYIGDAEALSKECLQALRDRMSGKIPQVPYRQDLIDLYETVDDLFDAQYKIIGECTERIQKYISDKVWRDKQHAMRLHTEILAILHINGREYQWLSRQSDKLFHTPESETVHIYEADVLEDENKDPKIKGMEYVFPTQRPPKKGKARVRGSSK